MMNEVPTGPTNDDPKYTNKERAFKISAWLRNKHDFVSRSTKQKEPIWMYASNKGIWEPNGEDFVRTWLDSYLADSWTSFLVGQIVSRIRDGVCSSGLILGDPEKVRHRIVLKNGTYDINEEEFYKNKFFKEEYQISAIPVEYDPKADCPKFKKFCDQVLKDESGERMIAELFGACLYKDYEIAFIMVFLGIPADPSNPESSNGANGKSTMLGVLRKFLGKDNCSSVTPQELIHDKFSKAQLHGKLACIAGDIPPTAIGGAILKLLTGNDPVNADHKNQPKFDFVNYAKLIYSANWLPGSYDDSDAFHRRMVVLDFPNTFPKGDPKTRPQRELIDSMTTEQELSGILNLALEGLKRFRANGQFSGEMPTWKKKMLNIARSDTVKFFAMYCCYEDPTIGREQAVEASAVEYLCSSVSQSLGKVPKTKRPFRKQMKDLLPSTSIEKGTTGDRKQVWEGLGLDHNMIDYVEKNGLEGLIRLTRPIRLDSPIAWTELSNLEPSFSRTGTNGTNETSEGANFDDVFDDVVEDEEEVSK